MTIANMSGKTLKHPMSLDKFMPTYLPSDKQITDPLQRAEYKAFKQKVQDIKR